MQKYKEDFRMTKSMLIIWNLIIVYMLLYGGF
jgi:hypothetical protein